ncbi:MAG: XRE family transcriptional regulator [Herbiconiux sp.]|uniref:helix-turn-helix domain-containing protein n=1 Tax=Herbiconiux sp. TaxID=1871186 RepID=UPI00121B41E3|nr:helix-turn-helix transcriptional regulator [Herbiconiux sp.]TAJ46332.1 MAG: XRE family transcriptional regulator [Herbiconiux sp.]
MTNQTFRLNGESVRVIRELRGYRPSALATRAEIDPGYLTKIENGQRQPSPAVLHRLAAALAVPLTAITYPVTIIESKAA